MGNEKQFERTLLTTRARDCKPTVPIWIWEDFIPLGEIVIFSGNPDVGKGCVVSDVVSRVTNCLDFPTGTRARACEVLIMSAEDSYEEYTARLIAAEAKMGAVDYLEKVEIREGARKTELEFALDSDLDALGKWLKKHPATALVIIDPISAYFGKSKLNDKQEVRRVMKPMQDLCKEHRVSIIGVEHFNKTIGQSAIHRLSGSVALVAGPRAAFMFAKVPNDEGMYEMHYIKANRAKKKTGLRYSIVGVQVVFDGKPLSETVPRIIWEGEAKGTADDLLNAEQGAGEDNRTMRATVWLKTYLIEPKLSSAVESAGKDAGHSRNALREAKEALHVKARKLGSAWWWYPDTYIERVPTPELADIFPTGRKPDDSAY